MFDIKGGENDKRHYTTVCWYPKGDQLVEWSHWWIITIRRFGKDTDSTLISLPLCKKVVDKGTNDLRLASTQGSVLQTALYVWTLRGYWSSYYDYMCGMVILRPNFLLATSVTFLILDSTGHPIQTIQAAYKGRVSMQEHCPAQADHFILFKALSSRLDTLGGDKVSMLNHKYPHKPLRKIKLAICNH